MVCPYCGREMEQGYIKSAQRPFWSGEGEPETGPMKLGGGALHGFFNGFSVESHRCAACGILITPVQER